MGMKNPPNSFTPLLYTICHLKFRFLSLCTERFCFVVVVSSFHYYYYYYYFLVTLLKVDQRMTLSKWNLIFLSLFCFWLMLSTAKITQQIMAHHHTTKGLLVKICYKNKYESRYEEEHLHEYSICDPTKMFRTSKCKLITVLQPHPSNWSK
jgi:hypothetical protein